jgi:hypothetical protein
LHYYVCSYAQAHALHCSGFTMGAATAGAVAVFVQTSVDLSASAPVSSGSIIGRVSAVSFAIATSDRISGKSAVPVTVGFSAFNFLDSAPPAPAPAASSAFTFMSNATPAPAPAPRPPRRWQRPVEQELLLQSCARWSDGARENAGQLLWVLAVHDRAPRLQCF